MRNYQITEWSHTLVSAHLSPGDLCIDATMGNGSDTEFLCRSVGDEGKVLAFDIQQLALDHTAARLEAAFPKGHCGRLILDRHEHMADYLTEEEYGQVSCIMFNLGYLPGGDHALATQADSSILAMEQGLKLLKKGGALSVCIYSGGDSGFTERDRVLAWLSELDPRKYLVLKTEYYNRPNHPPIPVLVVKL